MNTQPEFVLDDQLAAIYRDVENGITTVTWKESCSNLLDKDHQKKVNELNDKLQELSPKKLLVDLENCRYILSPKENEWYEHTLYKMFGLSRPEALAFVVPENLFNHLFFEVNQEAMKERMSKTQYFRNKEKAWNWLKAL